LRQDERKVGPPRTTENGQQRREIEGLYPLMCNGGPLRGASQTAERGPRCDAGRCQKINDRPIRKRIAAWAIA